MTKTILHAGTLPLKLEEVAHTLETEELGPFEVVEVPTMEEAEEYLFTRNVYLLITDNHCEGALDTAEAIKSDEMFMNLPILIIIHEEDQQVAKEVLDRGADAVLHLKHLDTLLTSQCRPLIKHNLFNSEMMEKISTLQEQAIRDFILLDLIKNYIPKTIWDRAREFAHQQKISIPEEELDLTIVFADIKGFTTMTQHMEPKSVVENLNDVFEIATRWIYHMDGDVDKFIGDAFFAVFHDPEKALFSMVGMQREIEALNKKRTEEGAPEIMFRVGIHTGPIIRGNVGGNLRFDNTLIGDSVNTASRLEHIAPPGGIMISDTTRQKIGISIPDEYKSEEILRGRDKTETIFSVFDYLKDTITLEAPPPSPRIN